MSTSRGCCGLSLVYGLGVSRWGSVQELLHESSLSDSSPVTGYHKSSGFSESSFVGGRGPIVGWQGKRHRGGEEGSGEDRLEHPWYCSRISPTTVRCGQFLLLASLSKYILLLIWTSNQGWGSPFQRPLTGGLRTQCNIRVVHAKKDNSLWCLNVTHLI